AWLSSWFPPTSQTWPRATGCPVPSDRTSRWPPTARSSSSSCSSSRKGSRAGCGESSLCSQVLARRPLPGAMRPRPRPSKREPANMRRKALHDKTSAPHSETAAAPLAGYGGHSHRDGSRARRGRVLELKLEFGLEFRFDVGLGQFERG